MFIKKKIFFSFLFILFLSLIGCLGEISSKDVSPIKTQSSKAFYNSDAFGVSEIRRLTRFEIKNSLEDTFNLPLGSNLNLLPEDISSNTHFDNNYESQSISPVVVSSYVSFAESYSQSLVSSHNFIQNFAGCSPQGTNDANCLNSLINKAGRLLLRRSMNLTETNTISQKFLPFAQQDNNFNTAVKLVLQYFIINPEFVYRIEGTLQPNQLTELNQFEIASRIAFFIWGAGPDEELLLAAEKNELGSPSVRTFHARRLLSHPNAKRQWQRFHSLWLGYSEAPLPASYKEDLLEETNALLDEIIFNPEKNWLEIFNYDKTYVSPKLAQFYNMSNVPNSTQWVKYTGKRGGGILAHGSFLSIGAKFNDTSPTLRGYEIYKRISCGELGPAPIGVDVNSPPGTPGDCKNIRYHMRKTTSCKSCHTITDNIGFGLENYSAFGTWRDFEPNNANCKIDNTGNWFGATYTGPKELGQLISKDSNVLSCSSKQLYRFLMGRLENGEDLKTIEALNVLREETPNLKEIIEEFIKSPAIQYKKGK